MHTETATGLEDLPADRREYVEVLLATDIFQDLTPAALGGLLPAVRRHRLDRGEFFYRVQEPSTHLWVLISGQGKMSMPGPDGDETVLDVMLPGQRPPGPNWLRRLAVAKGLIWPRRVESVPARLLCAAR